MAKASIAGNVHGAKAAAASPQTKRYYPQLEGIEGIHPEVSRAIRTLYDNVYQLRGDQQAAAGSTTAASGVSAASGGSGGGDKSKAAPDPANATGILGIQYKATTDPAGLPHAGNPTYNSATGQFEFSTPAGFAPAPAHAAASGTPGQLAHDGTHVYVCIGTNSWARAPLSSF